MVKTTQNLIYRQNYVFENSVGMPEKIEEKKKIGEVNERKIPHSARHILIVKFVLDGNDRVLDYAC